MLRLCSELTMLDTQNGRSDGAQAPPGGAEGATNRGRRSCSVADQRNKASSQRDGLSTGGGGATQRGTSMCSGGGGGGQEPVRWPPTDGQPARTAPRAHIREPRTLEKLHEAKALSAGRSRCADRRRTGSPRGKSGAAYFQSNGRSVRPTRANGMPTSKNRCVARGGGCLCIMCHCTSDCAAQRLR